MPKPLVEILQGYPFVDPYNAFYDAVYDHNGLVASGTKIVLDAGNGHKMVIRGSFEVDAGGKVTGGAMTGFDVYAGSQKVMHGSGFDYDAVGLTLILEDVNDYYQEFTSLFFGGMKIVGSNDVDYLGGADGASLFGRGGADWLYGFDGEQRLFGGKGDDLLFGGSEGDVMTGGAGRDMFAVSNGESALKSALADDAAFDVITDFSVTRDKIGLSLYEFEALSGHGALSAGEFRIGSQATTDDHRILYNKNTGGLFYDADGNGADARVKIAELDAGLKLKASHFLVSDLD